MAAILPNWDRSGLTFTACTGAWAGDDHGDSGDTEHLPDQLDSVGEERFELITLTAGGNDAGFGPLIKNCLGVKSPGFILQKHRRCNKNEAELRRDIDEVGSLRPLYDRLSQEHLADGGEIVVLGYPKLFERSSIWADDEDARCRHLHRDDTDMIRSVADYLNDELRQVASENDLEFLDVRDGYEDHNLCGSGGQRNEWMNGFAYDGDRPWDEKLKASFHPNRHGHRWTGHRVSRMVTQFDWD